jgi:hypothetical protein
MPKRSEWWTQYYASHRDEVRAQKRLYYRKNREKILEQKRIYHKENRDEILAKQRAYHARPEFSVRAAKYKAKMEGHAPMDITYQEATAMRAQQTECLICKRKVKLVFDHCHKTGKVRGLICFKCNAGLGLFQDSLSLLVSAVGYMRAAGEPE